MMQDEPDRQEQQRFFDLALKESDRLNDLLRDFLTFAQLDNPKKQVTNLADFIRNRLPREKSGLNYIDRLPDRLEVSLDPDQLGLAIDALILSLSEWAEGHGEIRVETDGNGRDSIRFLLAGKTVPVEYKNAVFQPFSKANRTSHGLALPTAMRAVHAHGGKLTLDTEAGVGTWFDLKL
jgi:two-component system sensor histidine kinase PilS (NtrC family)